MLRFRMPAIACGYEDANDCDALRANPLFKLAAGRAPQSGRDLCSQPTMSRLENAPSRTEVARMTAALFDLFCRSFGAPPATITLDIDDTRNAVHGQSMPDASSLRAAVNVSNVSLILCRRAFPDCRGSVAKRVHGRGRETGLGPECV